MAKDPTSPDDRASAQRSRRKPVTIDLAAAEVERKPAKVDPAPESPRPSEAAAVPPVAAAEEAPAAAAPNSGEASPSAAPEEPHGSGRDAKPARETVIPSAFATRSRERGFEGTTAEAKASSGLQSAPADDRSRSSWSILLAALAGGGAAAIIIIALALSGYLAPPEDVGSANIPGDLAALKSEVGELREANSRVPAVQEEVAALKEQLTALEGSVAELAARPGAAVDADALKGLQDRVAALEGAGASGPATDLGPRVAALAQEIDVLKSAAPPDTASLESALATLGKEVEALASRVEQLPAEERFAAIESKVDETSRRIGQASALAPAVAADALAAALDAGRPFQGELAALKSLGVDAAEVDALAASAEAGLPTLAELRSGFESVMETVALATAIPETTGAIDRLLQSARGLVEVRPAHPTAGSDPGAIVARIRGALAAGDLRSALAEWNTLPDTIKTPTADWARAAETRAQADDLAARVRTAALSDLGAGK